MNYLLSFAREKHFVQSMARKYLLFDLSVALMKDLIDRHVDSRYYFILRAYENLNWDVALMNFFLDRTVSISLNFQRVHVISKRKKDKVGTIRERKERLVKESSFLAFLKRDSYFWIQNLIKIVVIWKEHVEH